MSTWPEGDIRSAEGDESEQLQATTKVSYVFLIHVEETPCPPASFQLLTVTWGQAVAGSSAVSSPSAARLGCRSTPVASAVIQTLLRRQINFCAPMFPLPFCCCKWHFRLRTTDVRCPQVCGDELVAARPLTAPGHPRRGNVWCAGDTLPASWTGCLVVISHFFSHWCPGSN